MWAQSVLGAPPQGLLPVAPPPPVFHGQGDHVFNDFIEDLKKAFQDAGLPVPPGLARAPTDVAGGYHDVTIKSPGHPCADANSQAYGKAKKALTDALNKFKQNPTNAKQRPEGED